MAKNIMEVLGSKQQKSLQSLVELLFKSQAEAHLTHILQRKKLLCEHSALATYYDDIDGLIDSLAELLMAHDLISSLSIPACIEITNTETYFKELYGTVEKYRTSLNAYPFLISKLDDIQELISQTIYRLRFIQS